MGIEFFDEHFQDAIPGRLNVCTFGAGDDFQVEFVFFSKALQHRSVQLPFQI